MLKDEIGKEIDRAPLTDEQEMICQLVLEAELRNMGVGELVSELITAILEKDLFQVGLDPKTSDSGNDARRRRSA